MLRQDLARIAKSNRPIAYQKISISFPFIKLFNDYHEIPNFAALLSDILDSPVGKAEVGFTVDGAYVGLFWLKGQRSEITKQMIGQLIKQKGIELDNN